jgi:hypothetical protein
MATAIAACRVEVLLGSVKWYAIVSNGKIPMIEEHLPSAGEAWVRN